MLVTIALISVALAGIRIRARLVRFISVCSLVALLVYWTPEVALEGAPFHLFPSSTMAFLSCNFQVRMLTGNTTEYASDMAALSTISHCYYLSYPDQIEAFVKENNITREKFDLAHEQYLGGAPGIAHLNDTYAEAYSASFDRFLGNYNRSLDYGGYLALCWIVFFVGVALINWCKPVRLKPIQWIRKQTHIAAYKSYKTEAWEPHRYVAMLLPTRSEIIGLLAFSALVTVLCTDDMKPLDDDPLFGSPGRASLRYYAVRSSCIASWLMPLLILFGGRNNFLQWVTRWDYSTFIMLHRWVSRVVMVLFVIHTTCYSVLIGQRRHTKREETRERHGERRDRHGLPAYILAGAAAFFSGVFIMIQGLLVLRRSNYELFLALHILLALVFVLGAWYHVLKLNCVWFYYISAAIWLFDRLIRLARLASFGIQDTHVELFQGTDDNTLKVSCSVPNGWKGVPGGHAFIHFLYWDCFWQSHPFTYTVINGEMRIYIKVKEGVTYSAYKRLLRSTSPSSTVSLPVKVLVEGSYGEKTMASHYDHAVFVAGGNGIPGIYAEAIDLYEHSSNMITLIWAIRDLSSLDWFHDELMSLSNTSIKTVIYVTRGTTYNTFDGTNVVKKMSEYPHITFVSGRPDMSKIVSSAVDISPGSSCFVSCGNPAMVDQLRQSVVESDCDERVDYFEQLQVWA